MKLIVGTESTWSLRAFICVQIANIEMDLEIIDLSRKDWESETLKYSPTGLVPVLDTGTYVIHDSMAITEFLNECSRGSLYPESQKDRALSRSLCAELHSGFTCIREQCSFSLERQTPVTEFSDDLKKELDRISEIFENAQMPYMFGSAGAVDAFYSVMAFRLQVYGINFTGKAGDYQQGLLDWPVFRKAIDAACNW